jgi:hypothetical protein
MVAGVWSWLPRPEAEVSGFMKIQYDWNRDITLGLAYEFTDLGNAPINSRRRLLAGRLIGDYPTNDIQFVTTNLIWRF